MRDSPSSGAEQRLPNDNTLFTASARGRAFEVTPEGEIVWELRNPDSSKKHKPIVVVRARRLQENVGPGACVGGSCS